MAKVKACSNFETELKNLYGDCQIFGPYQRKSDSRKTVSIAYYEGGRLIETYKLYAKFKLEIKLGRRLSPEETVDHIDENPLNDRYDNLQLLSREENARKSSVGNKNCLGYKQSEHQRRSGAKNGKAVLSNEQVLNYRVLFSQGKISRKEIVLDSGLTDRSVRNILNYISYVDAGGPALTKRFKLGRKPAAKKEVGRK